VKSAPALRRAGRLADGWIGMSHSPETAAGVEPYELQMMAWGSV
jgi:hypothetical protein